MAILQEGAGASAPLLVFSKSLMAIYLEKCGPFFPQRPGSSKMNGTGGISAGENAADAVDREFPALTRVGATARMKTL